MDDDDEFYDTISVNSQLISKRKPNSSSNSKDYISLSRNTLYLSALDLEMELGDSNVQMDNPDSAANTKVPISPTTYSQWRERNWSVNDVDFVLAYKPDDGKDAERNRFRNSLVEVGLNLTDDTSQKIHFIKIHVPEEVLYQYAELLKLRMPLKLEATELHKPNFLSKQVTKILEACKVSLDKNIFPVRDYKLAAEFSRDKIYLFDESSPEFFNQSSRIIVCSYILEREKYGDEEHEKGIKTLLARGVYKAAYPLHDGNLIDNKNSTRKKLLDEWASVSKWAKYQPIDEIKEYFGVKIALYFAWLGFYTHMLIPAAVVGLLCLIYAVITLSSDTVCQDICNLNITMCPLCDKYCSFWELKDTCIYAKISHLIDNPITIFFSIFMSIWSALYLELWKRYSANIAHRWGLMGFDLEAEPPRPEYLMKNKSKKTKLNVITSVNEPVVPFWRVKLPHTIFSFSVVFLWMLLAVGVVFGIVIYRMSLVTSDVLYADKISYKIYVVPITSGLINLVCIIILNTIYNKLAIWLTEIENCRTQTEYEDSLTLKIYLFQFVNYYASIFYIAFLKGKFVGYPAKYNKILGYRQEECQPGGCLMELTIQLAIIMIGQQAINSILEIVIPLLTKMFHSMQQDRKKLTDEVNSCNQWTSDYNLLDLEPQGLFNEYLEMVMQYGFVTIFVAAFPLAPLFALINNIFEMRLDAKKWLKYFRRPVPRRVKDIGVWLYIMNCLCRLSIVTNAFIIAFSSNFIPKLVYAWKRPTDDGFLQYSLAHFRTTDFQFGTAPLENPNNITECRYAEYRNPPDHEFKYKRPLDYWHITAARLAFIVVYQNIVTIIVTCIELIIPDIPSKLLDTMKRETYEINENVIKQEKKMCKERGKSPTRSANRLSFLNENTLGDRFGEQNGGLHYRVNHATNEMQTTNL